MPDETIIIYFSDGTTEIIAASFRRVAQLMTNTDGAFMSLTTVDGRQISVNGAYVTRFSEPPRNDDHAPGRTLAGNALEVTGVSQATHDLARSIRSAASARYRRKFQK